MAQTKAAVLLLVLFLLLQGTKQQVSQQACPEPVTFYTCTPGDTPCFTLNPSNVNGAPLEGTTLVLSTPGTYQLMSAAVLTSGAKATCISSSDPNQPELFIIRAPTASGSVHISMTGANALLSLSGVTLQGGSSTGGISVLGPGYLILSSVNYQGNASPVTISASGTDCYVAGFQDTAFVNNVNNNGGGGALQVSPMTGTDPATTCVNVTYAGTVRFESNAASMGGAVYLDGNVNVNQVAGSAVSFRQNRATAGNGGAIYFRAGTTVGKQLEFDNVEFIDNSASGDGGAVALTYGRMRIVSTDPAYPCKFVGNSAGGSGGAVYVDAGQGQLRPTLTMLGVNLTGNVADTGNGGALYLSSASNPVVIQVSILNLNRAASGAAIATRGVLTLDRCALGANNATAQGGGIYASSQSIVTIIDCNLTQNVAAVQGGAAAVVNAELFVATATATTNINSNTATNRGGGLYLNSSKVTMTTVNGLAITFSSNTFTIGVQGLGAGVYVLNSNVSMGAGNDEVDVVFQDNTGLELQPGSSRNRVGSGGAMAVEGATSSVGISGVRFLRNLAGGGGALALIGGATAIHKATFESNDAGDGAAIYVSGQGNFAIGQASQPSWRTLFRDNKANGKGAAIFLNAINGNNVVTGSIAAACFIANFATLGIIYAGPTVVGYKLLLYKGLQSFADNASGFAEVLTSDSAGVMYCADDSRQQALNIAPQAGLVVYEGSICTDFASPPPVNECPAIFDRNSQTQCRCPAANPFDYNLCACTPPPAPSPTPPPIYPTRLVVTITGIPTAVEVGAGLNATVVVSGAGTTGGVISNVILTVNIPEGLSAASAAAPPGCLLDQSNSLFTCTIGNVAAGIDVVIKVFSLTATQAVTATITATATGAEVSPVAAQASLTILGACCPPTPVSGVCSAAAQSSACSGTFYSNSSCSTAACGGSPSPPTKLTLSITAIGPANVSVPVGQPAALSFNISVGTETATTTPASSKLARTGNMKVRSQQLVQPVDLIFLGNVEAGLEFQAPLPAGCVLDSQSQNITCQLLQVPLNSSTVFNLSLVPGAARIYQGEFLVISINPSAESAGLKVFVQGLGACCSSDQSSCAHTATAAQCSALNPSNTFTATKNCSATCSPPPAAFAGVTVDVQQTARAPKFIRVGRQARFSVTVTAPKAVAVNVTTVMTIPKSLKFLDVQPPDCTYQRSIITCIQPRLRKGGDRNIVITTKALIAGNATVVVTVDSPSGVDRGQDTLTVPILGGCCGGNITSTRANCRDTTARDCTTAGGTFDRRKSCKALEGICPAGQGTGASAAGA